MKLTNILTDKKWDKITYYLSSKGYKDLMDISEDVLVDLYFVPNVCPELISELKELIKVSKDINDSSVKIIIEDKDINYQESESHYVPEDEDYLEIESVQKGSENLLTLPWKILFDKRELRMNIKDYLAKNNINSIQNLKDCISGSEIIEIEQVADITLNNFICIFEDRLETLMEYSTFLEAKQSNKFYLDWDNFYSQIDLEEYFETVALYELDLTVRDVLDQDEITGGKRFINRFANCTVYKFVENIHNLNFKGINNNAVNESITKIMSRIEYEKLETKSEKEKLDLELNDYIGCTPIFLLIRVLDNEKQESALIKLIEKYNLKEVEDIKEIQFLPEEKKILVPLINAINKNFGNLLEEYLNGLKKRDYEMILYRSRGETLDSIGNRHGITRERVRQIVKRDTTRLYSLLKNLTLILERERGWFTILEVERYFQNGNKAMLFRWIIEEQSKIFRYYPYADLYINLNKVSNEWEGKFKRIVNEASDKFGDVVELFSDIEEELLYNNFNFITKSNIETFLVSILNFKVSHNMYRRPDATPKDFIAQVMSEYFEFDVKLDSRYDNEDILKIRKIIQRDFPEVKLPTNNRALTAVATRHENVILSGRGKYVTVDKVYFPEYLRESIFEWINKNPNTTLSYNEVFEQHKGRLLMESNLTNGNFLHGILKLYYEEEFFFNRDDFTKKGSERTRIDERLIELLNKNGEMNIAEISRKIPGIAEYQINAIADRSESIFKVNNQRLNLANKIPLTEEEIECLDKVIEMLLFKNDNYISSKYLMNYFLINNKDLVENSGLNQLGLFNFCRLKLSRKYRFSYPHIIPKGHKLDQSILSYKTILDHYFIKGKERISQSEIEKFINKYSWTEYVIYYTLQDLEEDYLRISEDLYMLKDKISITEEKKLEMDAYLDSLEIEFYAVQNFQTDNHLPEIDLEWNIFLIESFISQYSKKYRLIDRSNNYRHIVTSVVVPNNSSIEDYEDLLIHLIKKEGKNQITENELLRMLQNNGLTTSAIPLEIRNGEKINYNDRINLFEVVEN